MCVSMCMLEREREGGGKRVREGGRERGRVGGREGGRVCLCGVCILYHHNSSHRC